MPFKGILLEARPANERFNLLGTFSSPTPNFKLVTCQALNDTVTHSNSKEKHLLEVEWIPKSNEQVHDLVFV